MREGKKSTRRDEIHVWETSLHSKQRVCRIYFQGRLLELDNNSPKLLAYCLLHMYRFSKVNKKHKARKMIDGVYPKKWKTEPESQKSNETANEI